MRILHLADLHLGWSPTFLGEKEPERRKERDRLITRAVELALDPNQGIGLVLIAGDLFETHRPEPALVEYVIQQLQRLTDSGIQLITVPGNHDEITYHKSIYREQACRWPGLLVQNPSPALVSTMEINGETCHIYSLAYTGGITPTAVPLADFPRNEAPGWHVAVFHGSLDWKTSDRSLPISSEGLARAKYHLTALGHIHGHQVTQLPSGPAVYAGMIEGKGFSDPGIGFFTVITLDGHGIRVESIPAGSRSIRKAEIDIGLYTGQEELLNALRSLADPQAICRMILRGTAGFNPNTDQLLHELSGLFYHLEIIEQINSFSPELLNSWAQEPTIRGLFVRRLQEKLAAAPNERERQVIARALLNGLACLASEDIHPVRLAEGETVV